MTSPFAALFASRSRWFDLGVFACGLLLVAWSTVAVVRDGTQMSGVELLAILLIVVIAKFPMVLDNGDGGIEVGFDSSILMFLLCMLSPHEAIVLWSMGVLITQITTDKRPLYKLFNVGVGIVGGGLAAAVVHVVGGGKAGQGTPRELLAVALAATVY